MSKSSDQGEWNENARLVISALSRHEDLLLKMNDKLDGIAIQAALHTREVESIKEEVLEMQSEMRDSHEELKDLKKRVYKLENGEVVEQALEAYKKYVIAGIFVVGTSLVIPIVAIVLKFVA